MSGSLLGSRVECEGADTSYGDSDTKPAETCKGLHVMPAIKVSGTKYEIVESVAKSLDMEIVRDESSSEFDIVWTDSPGMMEKFIELKPYQRINHFPGMGEISRKDSLARNIQKMKKYYPQDYDFLPYSWILPAGYSSLKSTILSNHQKKKKKTYIVKPPNSSQGQGIYLLQCVDSLPRGVPAVVQEYIGRPLLIDGYKFDLRLYVLVTSCDPLKVFLYRDGLVRLSTKPYRPPSGDNLHLSYMHLTNYSINKFSDTFTKEDDIDKGSKRTFKWFVHWLTEHGYNQIELRERIADVITKTIISIQPHVVHSYQTCRPGLTAGEDTHSFFEILGFDIILDHTLKPWLLEVNRSPSFNTDSQLDLDVKTGVILDALKLINLKSIKRHVHKQKQKSLTRQRLLSATRRRTHSGGWSVPTGVGPPSTDQHLVSSARVDTVKLHELHKKMEEVRKRLDEIRWKKEQEEHELFNLGDYVSVYPPSDPVKAKLYSRLLREASRISLAGATSLRRRTSSHGLLKMKESELMELLSQYEATEMHIHSGEGCHRPKEFRRGVMNTFSSIEQDISHVAMTREIEEEKTQRVMVALANDLPPISGRLKSEADQALAHVREDWKCHQPNVAIFWFDKKGKENRRDIVQGVFDYVHSLMMTHWGRQDLNSTRLYRILKKLKTFLMFKDGQGLWNCFSSVSCSWEKVFKARVEVLSISEFECCRRVVRLCQNSLLAHYYFQEIQPVLKRFSGTDDSPKMKHERSEVPSLRKIPSVRTLSLPKIPRHT